MGGCEKVLLCYRLTVVNFNVMTCSSIVPRRTITLLIVHCTATSAGREVSLSEVDQWHRQRGWKGIGYHYLIRLDGTVEHGRPEAEIGAHCQNHNEHSIGICYVGGLDNLNRPADTRTPAQRLSLRGISLPTATRHDP